ncbi:hypothetical protein H0H92_013056 [Tricholoma furcatifolium]|nr:hypothetical protein H0H92_013056 [Tricholoma furcatifolium]
MSQNNPPLVGSVFERKQTSHSAPKVFSPSKNGFPVAQHRTKSAFARNIEGLRKTGAARPKDVPIVASSRQVQALQPSDSDEWRDQMSRENEQRVASMTEEEREEERQEILDRFGAGVGPTLATSLLTETLRFYTVLARYGLYSHIATTAVDQLNQLSQYILSDGCSSSSLVVAWLDLLTAWMVCAIDPHQTTPGHEILWSQIIAWGWNSDVDTISDRLGVETTDWPVWAGVWKLHAVWLEGSKVNGIRGGSSERIECLNSIKSGFEDGKEKQVVTSCLENIRQVMSQLTLPFDQAQTVLLRTLAGHVVTLSAAIRMWLSCLPPISDGPLESPPFPLPFSQLSDLCAMLTVHPLWSLLKSTDRGTRHAYVYLRPLSELLSYYLRLSRRLPSTSNDMWVAQALSVLTRLLPGDEVFASQIVDDIFDLITPEWMRAVGIQVPPVVWDKRGMLAIKPFVAHTIQSHSDISIGSTSPTTESISKATTQRLPTSAALSTFGLPLSCEWTLSPLDHLLRSGNSEVFRALPPGWDASEIDITCASLLLTSICREIMYHFSLMDFALTREEAVFGCMKVFMLEHGQTQATDSTEEVFRDRVVGQFMIDLLHPYTFSATSAQLPAPPSRGDLEQVSKDFLGTTPFYQYYTDFVALYDSISFSHPLFASLLLPPTSMKYALDYRKHLWNDFGHVLKTICTPADQVISGDLKDYLYPLEKDPQMLSFYLRALLKQQLQGFVHLVALHHIASSIWPDLNAEWDEERAGKLFNVAVGQGRHDLVREVVQYQQDALGSTLLPPQCFKTLDAGVKDARIDCITRWGLLDKLQELTLTI